MSTIAIGDIHGNLRALSDLLGQVASKLTSSDTVVFLGDIIDGAPESKGCVERIIQFSNMTFAKVVTLKGNHEQWFINTLDNPTQHSWLLSMQGFTTIASYSREAEQFLRAKMKMIGTSLILDHLPLPYEHFIKNIPEQHITFMRNLITYKRTPDCVCVHGGVSKEYSDVEKENDQSLIWGENGFPDYYNGRDIIIYGHWSNAVLEYSWPKPLIVGNTIGIDTIAHGVLTGIWMPDRRVIQSDRHLYT